MDASLIAEDEEPSETTTYDQSDGEVQYNDENNAEGSTDCRKRKLSVKPHKKGKVVRLLNQGLHQLTKKKERDRAHELNMMKMFEFQRGAPSMPQKYNQDYQIYNSPYIRPQPSPFSNPPLTPPTNEIIQLQRHVAGTRNFNGKCSQECISFMKPLKMTMKNQF